MLMAIQEPHTPAAHNAFHIMCRERTIGSSGEKVQQKEDSF
jgi:hypothetical protein